MPTQTPKPASLSASIREALRASRASRANRTPGLSTPGAPAAGRKHRGPKVKPLRVIDALVRVPLFGARQPERLWFPPVARDDVAGTDPSLSGEMSVSYATPTASARAVESPGRRRALGWQECEARFLAAGYTVIPTPDGRVTLASPGARADAEAIAAFGVVAGWIAAGRAGKPWPCAWCSTEAVTLLAGGVPACDEHAR